MTKGPRSLWMKLLVLPPLILAVAVFVWAAKSKAPPAKADLGEPTWKVRVVEVPSVTLVPEVVGHGTVQPERVWDAVAEVAGQVIETHERLRNGSILPAGSLLLRIDPATYELELAQLEAELAELVAREQNARASLTIDQGNVALAEKDLARQQGLATRGNTSESQVDRAEQAMLTLRQAVQSQKNILALVPAQRRLLEARIAQARLDLDNTTIRAPFDLRIANLQVEESQYVATGATLLEGDAIDRVEIVAQVSPAHMRALLMNQQVVDATTRVVGEDLPDLFGLDPVVRLDMGNTHATWPGRFVRMSDTVDPKTRTVGVVVAVDDPYKNVQPRLRPPLVKGMFVEVLLRGRPQPNRIIVPRSAIRGGSVYVVDDESRLEIRPVDVLFAQDSVSVIGDGLNAGETLVVSDLMPVVEGMLLDPVIDPKVTDDLVAVSVRPGGVE